MQRHLDSPAIQQPFAMADPAAAAVLLQDAGFGAVFVEPVEIATAYPRLDTFLTHQIRASTAAIQAMQAYGPAALPATTAALAADMATPIREATDGGRLRFPIHGIVARGTRA